MAFHRGPKIVTNGLVLALDAANTKSYPGTGTTWYDISGNNNHVTLYNGVSFSNNSFTGDGTNDYGRTVNNLNLTGLSAITIFSVFKTPATTSLGMLYEHTSNWNSANNYSGVTYGGFGLATNLNGNSNIANLNHVQLRGNSSYSGADAPTPDVTKFQYYTAIHNFSLSSNETTVYVNSIFRANSTNPGPSGNTYTANNTSTFVSDYLYFWSRGGTTSYSNASLSLYSIYNRALTAAEILQNYNAIKSRFGL